VQAALNQRFGFLFTDLSASDKMDVRLKHPKMKTLIAFIAAVVASFVSLTACFGGDWLIDNRNFTAEVKENGKDLTLSNGLAARTFRIEPNLATTGLYQLTTKQNYLRAVRPEAVLTIDGKKYNVGGLYGQPIQSYLLAEWVDKLTADTNDFRYKNYTVQKIQKRFEWKQHPEWLSQKALWSPEGIEVILHFDAPDALQGMSVNVHYELYNGLPLFCKHLTLKNNTGKSVLLNKFTSEIIAGTDESLTPDATRWELPNIYFETDYTFGGQPDIPQSVTWHRDPSYKTQLNYTLDTPCVLEVSPKTGPEQTVAEGEKFATFRTWELLYDSTDRHRKALSLQKMYRTIAPWAMENPILMHVRQADEKSVKSAIDQCSETGFEMVIMTFGSGFNMESGDKNYYAKIKELVDYAHSKKVALGGYSLLASRKINDETDVINPKTGKPGGFAVFTHSPCLGSKWADNYFRNIKEMYEATGLDLIEHDGSYPGDCCASTTHPGHKGYNDSQWNQWKTISGFYQWCLARGIYLNVPDWYFLNGATKDVMGYRETNWSLPRAQQEIIERQNVYDGTWNKTASMGWMFVPLTEYHGGGAAATIEPLCEHLEHYGQRFANLFGYGVQACFRGPRLYDTEETKAVVKRWVSFYKEHRAILDSDIVHLRRPDGQDWDGILHVNPQLPQKGMLVLYNPLPSAIEREIKVPLYYTGLTDKAVLKEQSGSVREYTLDRDYSITVKVNIPAKATQWFVIE
jgi:hypothetical protein